jgi:hypothetical protein
MADLELLTLDLRSPLAYSGLENPPIRALPFAGHVLSAGAVLAEAGSGEDLEEGMEELFLFDEDELVLFDPDEGPRLRASLPPPRFYGRRIPEAAAIAGEAYTLAKGEYAFIQWRPRDEGELVHGLEWFARQTWWEALGARGPYIVRRIREDSSLATQALRLLAR